MTYKLPITTFITATALTLSVGTLMAQDFQTGMSMLTIQDDKGERDLNGFIWYPTLETEDAVRAHGNAIWKPIFVHPDALPASGKYPLVVLSHGMYGNARNQAWLAERLTKLGYIVAAIDHPGTSTFQRKHDDARELWKRPQDISRTITYILETTAGDMSADPEKVYMAGHSLGGFTAVALAGGRFDPENHDAFCASQDADLACDALNGWEVAKSPEDRVEITKDLTDPRIKAFSVFDLGGTQAFSEDSLDTIDAPMLVFGAPKNVHGMNLDFESRALVASIPEGNVQYIEPEDLTHFDFLGECTDNGLEILQDEEPDDVFVCENGTAERAQKHDEISTAVVAFFETL